MKFRIKRGTLFIACILLGSALSVLFLFLEDLRTFKNMLDFICILLTVIILFRIWKYGSILLDEEAIIVDFGIGKDILSYRYIKELDMYTKKGPTLLYGAQRIRFTYDDPKKKRILELAPEHAEDFYAKLLEKMKEFPQ